MIVSAHQPNWMPWLGFWNKLFKSDKMILLDEAQYTKNSYINRVGLANKDTRFWWTVPVNSSLDKINAIEICQESTRTKIWDRFWEAYHKTKYFGNVGELVFDIVTYPTDNLSVLNIHALKSISKLMNLPDRFILQSTLEGSGLKSSELLADLCGQVGASVYLSGSQSWDYMSETPFNLKNIEVEWQEYNHPLNSGLSIVDALCNHGIDETKKMIMI